MRIQTQRSLLSYIPPRKLFDVATITLVAGAAIALGAAAFHPWSFGGGIGSYPIPGAVALGIGGSLLLVDIGVVVHALLTARTKRRKPSAVHKYGRHSIDSLGLTKEAERFLVGIAAGRTLNICLDGQHYTVTTESRVFNEKGAPEPLNLDFKAHYELNHDSFETLFAQSLQEKKDV